MWSQILGWASCQAWGFEVTDSQRCHARRTILHKGKQVEGAAPDYVLVKMGND